MDYPGRMKEPAKETTPPVRTRRVGRRPKVESSEQPELSRDAVIGCAARLAQTEPLAEISITRLARELGVTPGLIHYYVGSRDDLLSAVMNNAFRDRMSEVPPLTGDWRGDLEGVARAVQRTHARWPALATYIATHNRFRLFQKVQPGETDYGLAFFDHMGRIFANGGFTPSQSALAYHLLMTFLVSVGSATANRQAPKEHEDFIVGYVSRFDPDAVPGAAYLVRPFAKIDAQGTFEAGLSLLLDGFASWLETPTTTGAVKPKARKRVGS